MPTTTIILQVNDNGTATVQKVTGALRGMREEGVAGANALGQAWDKVKGTLGLLGIGLSGHQLLAFTKEAMETSRQAELAVTQLAFAVNSATNNAWNGYAQAVKESVEATSQYAIVTQTTAAQALQLLITNTGKVKESQDNLNLVFDLAQAKNMDVASAARIVSLAMEGNVTALKKQLPEFAELNDELEKHAIRSDRASVAMAFLHDKLDGQARAVGVATQRHKELNVALEEGKKKAGDIALDALSNAWSIASGSAKNFAGTLLLLTGNSQAATLAFQDGIGTIRGHAAAVDKAVESVKRGTAVLDALAEIEKKHADAEYRERLATDIGTAAINAKTAALAKLKEATDVLAQLQNEEDQAQLVRGGPDDAMRRIRQAAFEGTAGTSIPGIQGLISTTKGLTGADEEDKSRLLRDLTEQLRLAASSQASTARQQGGILTPEQQTALERSGGESTAPVGFGNATIIGRGGGRTITVGDIIINGADDPRETAKKVRQELLTLEENS